MANNVSANNEGAGHVRIAKGVSTISTLEHTNAISADGWTEDELGRLSFNEMSDGLGAALNITPQSIRVNSVLSHGQL